MLKYTILAAALTAAFGTPMAASAADKEELAEMREQIRAMKQSYEARLEALEQRLRQAQSTASMPVVAAETPAAPAMPAQPVAAANTFNPNISLILGGTLSNLSQDPDSYRLQGFIPSGGEVGPGQRGFSLGESELTMAANIDPRFSGRLTVAFSGENEVGVEEAYLQTRALSHGLNLRAGRFLSTLGYLNGQHAHTWDFVDAPLAYQAFFGGQYKADGVQAKWLAPTERFVELGAEVSRGVSFPGNERNKNGAGATTLFAHVGDDIGASSSWKAGLSYLRTGAGQRSFDDPISGVSNAFSGKSRMWIADAIYKWAPDGNPVKTNFKLQGEYFRLKEGGTLDFDIDATGVPLASGAYDSTQSGWYLQGIYQFMPMWRTGLRYDRLSSGRQQNSLASNLPILEAHAPARASVMFDYSPSEFSRLRLQLARDKSRPGVVDNQIFLQYIMSLGTHAAHAF